MRRGAVAWLVGGLLVAAPWSAAGEISFCHMNPQIHTYPNGLTLIVAEDHSAPVASVQAWCATGSVDEGDRLGAGLSHILEHMLFKGTAGRTSAQITNAIQDAGGYINAYTSFERTVFWVDVPAKGVPVAVDVLADVMMNATLPADEYAKEQEVIRREFAMGEDDPDRVGSLQLFATAYRVHPYRHPVIGHLDIYNTLTRDDVCRYYRARYVPNNVFFVVVGDVDAAAVAKRLGELTGGWRMGPLPVAARPVEPPQFGRRERVREFATELTRLDLAWHVPAVTDPDVPALDLLAIILGGGRSSRLYKKIREELGLAHAVSAFCYTPDDPGLFGIEATLDPGRRAAVEREALALVAAIKSGGVTEEEVEKARKQSLSQHLAELTTVRGRASDLGSSWLLTQALDFSARYLEALQRVTADDVRRVAEKYLPDDRLTVTAVVPKAGGPGEGGAAVAGEDAGVGPIQKFVLANGLRLLVREDRRLPLVSAVAMFKAGVLAETPANNGITKLCAQSLLKGTATRSAAAIADEIEAVGGTLSAEAGNNSMGVALRVMRPDWELGLAVLADVLQRPTFPEREVARERELQLAALKAEDDDVMAVAMRRLREKLFAGHPYGMRPLGTVEALGRLTREDLAAFQRRQIVGANGVVAVFGDVRVEEVRAAVERLFGGMPAGKEAFAELAPPAPLAADATVEELRDKQQAVLVIGYRASDMFDPDADVLELLCEASSDLGSRFGVRIREEMGLAYYVSSMLVPGLVPGLFAFYLGTAPEKLAEVQAAFTVEIGRLAREGLTAEELARAKEKLLGQQDIRNQSNDAMAQVVALDELYGLGFEHHLEARRRVAAVDSDGARRVARKYFAGRPAVTAVVRPPTAAGGGGRGGGERGAAGVE